MLPKIWIFDTYSILFLIGIGAAFLLFNIYMNKRGIDKKLKYAYFIVAVVAILGGIISAMVFQMIFDALKGEKIRWFAMTFYGGLIGGAVIFILLNQFVLRKKYLDANLTDLLIVAPAAITVAHGFGRIGCFCAGCCYGIETDSIFGVKFPLLANPRYPTQLFEAAFLFILTGVLFYLALKQQSLLTMPIYLLSYGMFRFLIEFIRGDDRGAYFLSLSPSQWLSILFVISAIILFIILDKRKKHVNVKLKE